MNVQQYKATRHHKFISIEKQKLSSQGSKAFTLIELLVVIAIVGLISSIVSVSLNNAREEAIIAKILTWSSSIRTSMANECVGEWRFEEGAGLRGTNANDGDLVNDSSGNGNIGTIHGDPLWQRGANGASLEFDGTGDYISVADDSCLNVESITIEMWVKQNSRDTSYTFLFNKAGGSYHLISEDTWAINNVGFTVRVGGTNYRLWTSKSLVLEEWRHLAFVYNSGTGDQKTYFNGELDTSASRSPGNIDAVAGSLDIGGEGLNRNFDGFIDEVRVYSEALIAERIKENYMAGMDRHQNLVKK